MPDAAPRFDPDRSLGYALKRAQAAMRLHMDRSLAGAGLTAPQYAVLAALEAEPGLSNADLARRAFVTPQTMQTMLAKLERGGLVERRPDEAHGRILRTAPTEAGRTALRRAHAAAARSEAAAREAAAPADPDAAAAMLDRIAKALR